MYKFSIQLLPFIRLFYLEMMTRQCMQLVSLLASQTKLLALESLRHRESY